jgi:hypothetical protein
VAVNARFTYTLQVDIILFHASLVYFLMEGIGDVYSPEHVVTVKGRSLRLLTFMFVEVGKSWRTAMQHDISDRLSQKYRPVKWCRLKTVVSFYSYIRLGNASCGRENLQSVSKVTSLKIIAP